MTDRVRLITTLFIILALFICLQMALYVFNHTSVRSSKSLLNQYYALRIKHPDAAKRALELILENDPNDIAARIELGKWYINRRDFNNAIIQFKYILNIHPNNKIAMTMLEQIQPSKQQPLMLENNITRFAYKSCLNGRPSPSHYTAWIKNAFLKANSAKKLDNNKEVSAQTKVQANTGVMTERDKLLNLFYAAKREKNTKLAWIYINELLALYGDDVTVLKEAGYLALSENNDELAYKYLSKAYQLTCDTQLALQDGYILDKLNRKREAYYYFDAATNTADKKERLKAEIAMTNLRGYQTQYIPFPFFAELYADPVHFSRFALVIYQEIFKAGITLNQKYNLLAYLVYRRTSDDRSGTFGVISNIYEDNAAVTDIGVSINPFVSQPLVLFMEAGKAFDLVYRDRGRWRNDFRTGLAYYNEWGRTSEYTFKPEFPIKFKADLYADNIYYSRYLDWIGTMRARPGFEFFRLGSSSLTGYVKVFVTEDTQRFFYNNIIEYGPSVVWVPSDRYNIALRYENLKGHYLPSGGKYQNPYPANYHNNVTQLDIYFRF